MLAPGFLAGKFSAKIFHRAGDLRGPIEIGLAYGILNLRCSSRADALRQISVRVKNLEVIAGGDGDSVREHDQIHSARVLG